MLDEYTVNLMLDNRLLRQLEAKLYFTFLSS